MQAAFEECSVRREPVESTSVMSMGYDPRSATLEVEFANGGVYRYFAVPRATYERLRAADSIGRFVNFVIKPHHRFVRMS
ncbi:MAG: hypothetical protein QOI11_3545 [Candidatus Eremiobacteraeota bacterium]|nr:hypothetical protein [Candidatus Eremiobacteraeota bacterium]